MLKWAMVNKEEREKEVEKEEEIRRRPEKRWKKRLRNTPPSTININIITVKKMKKRER